ncbi:MAG: CpaF family protein [Acidimicrobiia bacterium]
MTDPLVEQLRRIVVSEVGEETARREQQGLPPLDAADRRQMARSIMRRELDGQWRAAQQRGEMALTPEEEDAVTEAVLAGLFSQLPGLEGYLLRRDVTDIFVVGHDNVRVRTLDGRERRVPPVAASDDDLIEQVQALARKGGRLGLDDGATQIEKEFSPARPLLDLQLSDGSRLAAAAWVSARPYVSVRRHALVDADQETLVREWKMYDEGIASLLGAAMRARLNILVAGGMGRGKTTLMRALLHECPPDERIVVLEQERELQLGLDPDRHNHVLELVERPANMEGEGSVTLADLTWAVKRHAPDRIVVGEVRGPEVMYMLEAACDGIAGTLCTLHARSSHQTFEKLVNYARRGGAAFDRFDVLQTAAYALDLVIYLGVTSDHRRVISEITQVLDFDPGDRQIVTNDWFVPGPDGAAVPNPNAPIPVETLDMLLEHGYEPGLHRDGAW